MQISDDLSYVDTRDYNFNGYENNPEKRMEYFLLRFLRCQQ